MAFGDADRAYMLGQDFGSDVTYDGTTVDAQIDGVTEDMLPRVAIAQLGYVAPRYSRRAPSVRRQVGR